MAPKKKQKKKISENGSLSLISSTIYTNRFIVMGGLISLIIVDILQLFIPRIVKMAVDDLTLFEKDSVPLYHYAWMILIIGSLIFLFRYFWRKCLMGVAQRVEAHVREQLFIHLQKMSPSYFDRKRTGDLMAHATNDIDQVRLACGMGIVALNDAVFMGLCSIGFMFYIHIELTLYVLIPMPLIVIGTRFFGRSIHFWYKEVQSSFSELTEGVRERMAGIRIIKAYTCEKKTQEQMHEISQAFVDKNVTLTKRTGLFFPMVSFFSNISLFIVLVIGGRKTILREMTPGDFVAFISYLSLLTWPMMAMGWVTNLVQRGRASLDRLTDIIKTEPEIVDSEDSFPLEHADGTLSFDHVFFGYGGGEPVLKDISITVPKGSVLGVVGPQGAGKTTLLNLIPRFYDVMDGSICLDGNDIRKIRLCDLRKHIVTVPQEPFLFAGTIRDNITFGDPSILYDQLIDAARKAALLDTIESFPQGWNTLVGEKGIMLSGGQKQRVGFARALLKSAPVMIFDDPVSQVDSKTAFLLLSELKSVSKDKTVLIVSHRVAAVRFADRIITLSGGRIAEVGTHEELIEKKGYYEKIFRLQEIENEA